MSALAYLELAARWALALLLAAAGATKVPHKAAVEESVKRYGVLPLPIVRPVAQMLPWTELCLALVLVVGVMARFAALLAAGMLTAFVVAIVWNLIRGKRFECGCGTGYDTEISWGLVARDATLVLVAGFVVAAPDVPLAVWPVWHAERVVLPAWDSLLPVPLAVGLAYCIGRSVGTGWRVLARARALFEGP